MTYELAPPEPAGLIATLSSLGYSLPAAVADLVDNSISAEATGIDVEFTWSGSETWIAVSDDGTGMSPAKLVTAMTVAARGPQTERSAGDLGRFGVGLKSASFSQARQLVVTSSVSGAWHTRCWDLDLVESTGQWRLLSQVDDETEAILTRLRASRQKGTVVLWRRLNGYSGTSERDSRLQKQFYAEARRVEEHLAMVFARYLTGVGRRQLRLSGTAVKAWDPFLTHHPSVLRLPPERHPVNGGEVKIEAFVLPSAQRLTASEHEHAGGPSGWLDQQGFYVYRRDRLILAGDWLGLRGMRKEEKYNLARIAIDVPAEADVEWSVDVRKSSMVPPVALRPILERLARATRERAADVLRHRGLVAARTHGDPLVYTWVVSRSDGRLTCRINRSHPLVQSVLKAGGTDPARARALLRLLEETVPVATLRVMHETDTEDDPEPFGGPAGEADADVTEVAQQIFESLVAGGRSPTAARDRLRTLSPFDQLRGFWSS
ncbi:ATP-binding protein [Streptacidiphilus sp. MAP5-3]|uniref:ATP-binding protein n=1 Tax=unclassified Streptacidiphilus TaxID=2643834 RepID=UPI0035173E94